MIRLIYGNTEADCVNEKTDLKVAVEGTLLLGSTFKIVCDTEMKKVSILNVILSKYYLSKEHFTILKSVFLQYQYIYSYKFVIKLTNLHIIIHLKFKAKLNGIFFLYNLFHLAMCDV